MNPYSKRMKTNHIPTSGSKLYYGKIKLPKDKKVAVAITVDFDGASGWDGTAHRASLAYLERGRFGAEFGVPRLLEILEKNNIKSTWFIPGHTFYTFSDACEMVIKSGHEIGAHGYDHENITELSYEEEAKIMENALLAFKHFDCKKPVSYRSPAWDYSPNTTKILIENEFQYDSSLMASDIYPFFNQNIVHDGNSYDIYSEPSGIINFPPSWFLDDFVEAEFALGLLTGLKSTESILYRWKELYDFAAQQDGACYVLTIHPQTIGRGHMLRMFQNLLIYLQEKGAWFTTIEEMGKHFIPDL